MSASIEQLSGVAFLPFTDMEGLLQSELKARFNIALSNIEVKKYGSLLYLPTYNDLQSTQMQSPYWSKCTLFNPFLLHFDSIADAANALKQKLRSWAPYQYTNFRRASLIQDKLPYVNLKNRNFPFTIPNSPIGLYTLIDEHTIIASANTSSCLPAGNITWVENHTEPPSRAYLKIQESLVLANHFFGVELPKAGQRCFEAGACPGGWTWVLVNLGANVFAVDRSELVPSLMQNSLVEFKAHDAFTLTPQELGKFDWIFSDVICYPERLLEWVKKWIASGNVRNMICTIKMQGAIDWNIVAQFQNIPNSRVVHLNYNKHELTFIHCNKAS